MGERRKIITVPKLALVISILAAGLSGVSLWWQTYMWDHATAELVVDQIGENEELTSVLVRNSGRASATIGGFKISSKAGEAYLVLNPSSGPAVIPSEGGNLIPTQTAALPPGGLEYLVLAFGPVAQQCVNMRLGLEDLQVFLVTGDGDVPFALSDHALKNVTDRVSALADS